MAMPTTLTDPTPVDPRGPVGRGDLDLDPADVDAGYEAAVQGVRRIVPEGQWSRLTGGRRNCDAPAGRADLTPDQLVALADHEFPPQVVRRASVLGEAVSRQGVSRAERGWLWGYVLAEDFVTNLKLEAMSRLGRTIEDAR